ncbi:major facilitator superfamily permease [Streptococcus pneumoniae]|nr:major facilitator superfamily permease [Streptococcus pneumoniae]
MKLLFRNPAYRILTLSRFFNAFGASIFNLVFIVYASILSQASFAVAMANIVMILPTLFTPNHSYLSQLDVTYKTPDLMSHFLPPHEVSFTFCCSSIVFPR